MFYHISRNELHGTIFPVTFERQVGLRGWQRKFATGDTNANT